MVASWWGGHKWPVIPQDALPRTGVVAFDGETGVCAAFLYETDSCMAWLEFVVSNPMYKKKPGRSDAVDMVIKNLMEKARGKLVFSSTKHDRLLKRYVDAGFEVADLNVTHVIWNGGQQSCR
jgi:hypothetical protein